MTIGPAVDRKEHAMYAMVTRRRSNPERQEETRRRAADEFFPKLRQAPGFVAFYLVAGEDGVNSAISVWESREQAEAFRPEVQAWSATLEELGNRQESITAGEVLAAVTPQQ
jgi:quinol monooxygenase YgiN